jgi:putative transposase
MKDNEPPRRRHLRRLDHISVEPLYFITGNTLRRQAVLVPELAEAVISALRSTAELNRWAVGRFVVMPDHVHFFCRDVGSARSLSDFIGGFKQLSTRNAWTAGWDGKLWQAEFFDHLLRSGESYEQKWNYVRHNPVRAGLCASPDDWAHQGEIARIDHH